MVVIAPLSTLVWEVLKRRSTMKARASITLAYDDYVGSLLQLVCLVI